MSKHLEKKVEAYFDWGEDNDPEALGLAFHYQNPTFIDTYCQAATNLIDWDYRQGVSTVCRV